MPRLKPPSFYPPLTFAFIFSATAGSVYAQTSATSEEQRLQSIEQELKDSEAEKARLIARQENVTRELAALRATMIGLAKTIQARETALTELETRLSELEATERGLKERLGVREEQLQRTAMALQRLALRPSDAVNLSPLKPDDAVRTAILLRAAVPEVQTSAKALEGELSELTKARKDVEEQQEKVALAAASLIEQRRALEQKEQDKAKLQLELAGATDAATAKLQKLASEAADLKDLVAKITAERAQRAKEREAARIAAEAQRQAALAAAAKSAKPGSNRIILKPPPGVEVAQPPESTKSETQVATLPGVAKPTDMRPFSKARGTMPTPAVGSLKHRYGESGGEAGGAGANGQSSGNLSKGIVIAARAGGQVIAPFDGTVAFAGPFRGYGLLLIIEHSEGYHTLLAGLGRIDCVLDQRVFAGEPVGVMGSQGASDLYVELRQNGQPVNPLPWLESRTGKSSG
ncbi:MAG: peptidoglycan DD-metalloendopeptidase family protein [Rhodospirillaceae bacterium]|nr:peptidoglycan DD-metalloendopeptidase family protein [Rhodospirillaceae bacterium]